MKKLVILLLSHLSVSGILAQELSIDSLKEILKITDNDTLKLSCAGNIANLYNEIQPDSSVVYADIEMNYARKLRFKINEAHALAQKGYALNNLGTYPQSLQSLLLAITIAEDPASEKNILPDKYRYGENKYSVGPPRSRRLDILARAFQFVGILYGNASNNLEKEKMYFLKGRAIAEETGNNFILSLLNGTLGRTYLYLKMLDSARLTEEESYAQSLKAAYPKYHGSILLNLARIYAASGDTALATEYFKKALVASQQYSYLRGVVAANLALAELYANRGKKDSSFYFINDGLNMARYLNAPSLFVRSYSALAKYFRTEHKADSVVKYQDLIIRINDSLFSAKQAQLFQSIDFDEQQRQQKKEAEAKAYLNRLKMYGLLAGLAIFLIIALLLWRGYRNKQRAFSLLAKQKQETDHQRLIAEQTLTELKSTQAQLIHSEKMASLGELTLGIAHEIENPLNFVNNFSEVNVELLEEMKQALKKGNAADALVAIDTIQQNQTKIISHGKRADEIVKNMLQHSRSSTGQKESVDINFLAEEYLRLSYHGFRAKDKSFHAHMHTDFDKTLGSICVIPQQIGRVLLNLFNNSFYAVNERQKQGIAGYEPTVSVSTKKVGDNVQINVNDNGTGIRQSVKDKIFQPFFTTKPTGQGTGLGLSLSYDIVKAHGGELKLGNGESENTEFIISIPV